MSETGGRVVVAHPVKRRTASPIRLVARQACVAKIGPGSRRGATRAVSRHCPTTRVSVGEGQGGMSPVVTGQAGIRSVQTVGNDRVPTVKIGFPGSGVRLVSRTVPSLLGY